MFKVTYKHVGKITDLCSRLVNTILVPGTVKTCFKKKQINNFVSLTLLCLTKPLLNFSNDGIENTKRKLYTIKS